MLTREEFLQADLVETERGLELQFDGRSYRMMFYFEEEIVKQGVVELFNQFEINSVIEIGFGLGYTAQKFQDLGIDKHYILEPHPEVYQRALAWRETQENKENIFIFNEFWQDWRRLDGTRKITADLVYYDVAEWVMSEAYDFPRITEEVKPNYFKWGNIIAGYAREDCERLDEIEKIDFSISGVDYIQPYKVNT